MAAAAAMDRVDLGQVRTAYNAGASNLALLLSSEKGGVMEAREV